MIIKRLFSLVFAFTWLLASAEPGASENLYKYRDAKGVIHLTNIQSDNRFRPVFKRTAPPLFTKKSRRWKIDRAIEKASRKHSLDSALIRAVVRAESNFNPYAVSYAGAQGLMQLMPETADYLDVINPFDIEENIYAGAKYLKQQLNHFDGDVALSVAAYNAGRSAVIRHGGIPPYKQTKTYVKKVLAFYNGYKKISRSY
ncbi:MAG: lytic transglycosylase domain-containing protein [Proteobacteria bacterium]|nr:lytic transglycosylase domain-containing protein [Pseudomonadota bacterium]